MSRLQNKVALVTGGANGIGKASSILMAANGARVVVADLALDAAQATVETIRGRGGDALALTLDAFDNESIRAVVEQAKRHYGALHILYNNVGGTDTRADASVLDMEWETWQKALQLNLLSTAFACRCAIPYMIEGGGGSIINTSSKIAIQADMRPTAYAAAKGAVISLTRSLAAQYGRQNIRCNAIAPGMVLTPRPTPRPQAVVDIFLRHNLLPYLGQAEDIGHVAVFLASDESRYMTGQVLEVDGGAGCHGAGMADMLDLTTHSSKP